MFGLLHNCVIHPVCGVIWFVADTTHNHKLDQLAERLHKWDPRKKRS